MADLDAASVLGTPPSVFLSYASQDRDAARLLRDALVTYGIDVWYDESDLGGGDAWDQKIRRQIRDCDYFMPMVSAQTEARHEGYFRREWRLAVERTQDMADDHPFLLPVTVDDTRQTDARVPDKFLAVQWLKVPGGQPTAALEALCRRIVAGELRETSVRKPSDRPGVAQTVPGYPPFPEETPGRRLHFLFSVLGWACLMVWTRLRTLPRWIRYLAVVWFVIAFISRCDSSDHKHADRATPAQIEKLKAISQRYQGATTATSAANLGQEIARQFSDAEDDVEADGIPLLALPFTAPAGDSAAESFAKRAFAMSYGMAAISHRGGIALNPEMPASPDLDAAVLRGKANHSTFVLHGQVRPGAVEILAVSIAKVADGSVIWSGNYPIVTTDPGTVATDVDRHLPRLKTAAD